MNPEITNITELSIDQLRTLAEIISDQSGHNLSYDEFTDQVLLILEDISGFEVISDSESQTVINQLWSYYHGHTKWNHHNEETGLQQGQHQESDNSGKGDDQVREVKG